MTDSVDSGRKHDNTSDEFLDPSCDPCKNQKKYVKVVSYCPACVEYFCKDCDRAHANFQITKKHRLKHGSNMPSCEADKPPKFQDCRIHANAIRDWFCIDHNVMICSKCRDQHDKCFLKHANDMSQILSPSHVSKIASDVSAAKDVVSTVISKLEENVSEIEKSRTYMLEIVKIEYDKMRSEIARKFHANCEDINKTCSDYVDTLTAQKASMAVEIAQYDSVLDIINKEMKSSLDTKLFVKMQTLVENTNESIKTVYDLTNGIQSIDLEFIKDKTWNSFLSNDSKIGFVKETISQTVFGASLHYISFPPNTDVLFQGIDFQFQEIQFDAMRMERNVVTGAIEIGRLSFYGFAFNHSLMSDVFDQQFRKWYSMDGLKFKIHVPTAVLIDPRGEALLAFGYEAQEEYSNLLDTGQHVDYYYFENCGTDLEKYFQKKQMKNATMSDATGKSMSTVRVLTFIARYLIDDLMQQLKEPLLSEDITMAVVLPSLSTDDAKGVVKEAIMKTGITASHITIIPEAQAISEFCQSSLEVRQKRNHQNMLSYGEDYMIINFRDDIMEVIINKYNTPLPKRVVYTQFTKGVGEMSINAAFEDFLQGVVGKDVFQAFSKAEPEALRNIQEDFESRKAFLDTQKHSITFSLENSLFDTYISMKGQTLKKAIQKSKLSKDVKVVVLNKLVVSNHLIRGFFDVPVIPICLFLQSALQTKHADKIKCVFMTGKLALVCEFQRAVKAAFPTMNLFFPQDPDYAAVQGAVIHAYKQMTLR